MERPAPSPGGAVISFDVTTPVSANPVGFALSPDGRQLVFLADSKLWLRRLDQNVAQPLNGTDGATTPFWSPDSRSVGFLAGGKLKRIDVASGSVLALSIIPVDLRGASWNHENVILYGTNIANGVIQRLSAIGGVPTDATRGVGQGGQRFPQFLPDGRHFIFTVTQGPLTRSTYLGTLDALEVQDLKLVSDSSVAIAAPNHLLFLRKGTLMMATLDLARGGSRATRCPSSNPSVSVRRPRKAHSRSPKPESSHIGAAAAFLRQLTWVDRHGQVLGQVGPVDDAGLFFVQVSPDDQRIAVQRTIDGNADLWITDASRAGFTRLRLPTAWRVLPYGRVMESGGVPFPIEPTCGTCSRSPWTAPRTSSCSWLPTKARRRMTSSAGRPSPPVRAGCHWNGGRVAGMAPRQRRNASSSDKGWVESPVLTERALDRLSVRRVLAVLRSIYSPFRPQAASPLCQWRVAISLDGRQVEMKSITWRLMAG